MRRETLIDFFRDATSIRGEFLVYDDGYKRQGYSYEAVGRAARGFAALENTLFILTPLLEGDVWKGAVTGNMRFMGASMLHVVCSAILGYAIGSQFHSSRIWKMLWRLLGLSLAIGLHTLFNLFIIGDANGSKTFLAFSVIWMMAIVVMRMTFLGVLPRHRQLAMTGAA